MKDVDMNQIRSATITYVNKPTDNQLAGIKKFIADQLDVNVDELDINLGQLYRQWFRSSRRQPRIRLE